MGIIGLENCGSQEWLMDRYLHLPPNLSECIVSLVDGLPWKQEDGGAEPPTQTIIR